MSSDPTPLDTVGMIHKALEEIHTLLSDLETQLKPASFFASSELSAVETVEPEEGLTPHENGFVSSISEDELFL